MNFNINDITDKIGEEFKDYGNDVVNNAKIFILQQESQLTSWAISLQNREITQDDFEFNCRGLRTNAAAEGLFNVLKAQLKTQELAEKAIEKLIQIIITVVIGLI